MQTEKTYCKVWSWTEDSLVGEFFLPNGEILRVIKGDLFEKLLGMGVVKEGGDFLFVANEENGVISADVAEYIAEINPEIEQMFKELEEMMEYGE